MNSLAILGNLILDNFQKSFFSPKMMAILNFSQKLQNTKCLYLENHAR